MNEQRVARIERAVGVTHGPRVPCPTCEGTGQVHSADGRWYAWEFRRRFAVAEGVDFDEPEPAEALSPCGTCRATGEVAEARAAAMASDLTAARAWLARRFIEIRDRLAVEIAEPPDEPPPPTLRPV